MDKVQVVGIGNSGVNVVKAYKNSYPNVECIMINSDRQSLESNKADNKICLDEKNGLSCGGDSEFAKKLFQSSENAILKVIDKNSHIILVTGLGGGCGTGGVLELCQILEKSNCSFSVVVSVPFGFEGQRRKNKSLDAFFILSSICKNVVIVKNDNIEIIEKETLRKDVFKKVDENFILAINKVVAHI